MRHLIGLIITSGILMCLKLDQASGRLRTIIEPRADCSHGDCLKRDYPWIEALYRKQQEPFLILNKMDQRRFSQPYLDYFINSKINKPQMDNNLLTDNVDQQLSTDPDVLRTFQYLQDHSSDNIQQTWQENDSMSSDENNNIFDKTNTEILQENFNNSLSKRTFYRNQNDYDAFLALAGLSRNFSLENMKHTRGHAIPSDDKFKSVDRVNCSCNHESDMLDFGRHFFPRVHLSYQCSPDSCFSPLYSCKGKQYKIWVLKKREEGDPIGDRNTGILPEPFKRDYLFVEKWITVACECAI